MEDLKVLQDRVAELELQLEEANNKNASLQASNASLAQANASLAGSIDDMKSQVQAAHEEVEKLRNKNAKYENPTFKHGDEEYEIVAKNAIVPGHGPVTAADIAADQDLQKALVEKKSGLIRKKA
jgi:chromosome segregation ATPase